MRRVHSAAVFLALILSTFSLNAQNTNTTTNTTPTRVSTNQSSVSVSKRYEAANDRWRLNAILMILKDDSARYNTMLKEMKDFTSISRSYVIFKRKGHIEAKDIYYRNLENISRIEQIKQLLDTYKKEFTNFNKDFIGIYKLDNDTFKNFDYFEKSYQKILNRWRGEFEAAMKAKNRAELQRIRQDMQLLRLSITVFILFPGKSAIKVPQLQNMENDIRHAVVMVKMYETENK